MRLPLRSKASRLSTAQRQDNRAHERQSPSGVLATWLRQGVRHGTCPLCRVAHKADREYIWHLFDEGADQGGILNDLEALGPGARFVRARCPACANRDERVRANAEYLLDELVTNPGLREKFEASPRLCFAHFELVWGATQTDDERALIARVQRDATARLVADLDEHIRKHDHRYKHEPSGPERDSWRRWVRMTAGWPPPAQSAAGPEAHR